MAFQLDHPQFESMTEAFLHILSQYAVRDNPQILEQTASGLMHPREVPGYLFRGECGEYPTTTASIARLREHDGLSKADVVRLAEISDWVAARLREEREGLSWPDAFALLQHYGMPSRIVDFTGDLGLAFAFAAHGKSSIGRLAVVPYAPCVLELFAHPWAERAQRQAAYGIVTDPKEVNDLKADAVRARLGIKWYEFQISTDEKQYSDGRVRELLQEPNDPSAGFVRYYITRYVEAFGKLSQTLTRWLLNNVVIAPYCFLVAPHEEKEAVVYFRGSDALPTFDKAVETEWSRRYWSEARDDDSINRVKDFVMPSPGAVFADPRTYHPES
jgi:FRG domain-containing protein